MLHVVRTQTQSGKNHRKCAPMALEALEPRNVPAVVHPALSTVALELGVDNAASANASVVVSAAAEGNTNGAAGQMPAFYEGQLFTVNMKEMPQDASASLIAHNANTNTIYASNDLDDEQDFKPVIDAIQGENFNPLWRQVLIVFNKGFTPHQFVSADEVKAAAAGPHPEITLVVTDEIYRCSVVGGSKHA